ncbi:MAG: tRNA (adenosine(37)-N6)-threonylcarbamoyltransferase complex ATPase subunit type 1 TsaE [Paracoccaceae bacterium]|jgi:tRNA threonylcarbamoyladenosine biosynthesis protein TsaE|nr:tRNA (adenosine(37)-N6)-threonylcarbamoyltransferase complex ATPase subunit type 1 TsaE [Paracoccaceae bacterium]
MVKTLKISSADPNQTTALGKSIAQHLRSRDVILLEGQIGGGKTHFARSVILALLDEPEGVPSPTFTLVQTYHTQPCEIWHCDLYRLSHPDEVFELGLVDAFSESICLIEWPDRLGDLRPNSALTIEFAACDVPEHRYITARWTDPRWDFLEGSLDV